MSRDLSIDSGIDELLKKLEPSSQPDLGSLESDLYLSDILDKTTLPKSRTKIKTVRDTTKEKDSKFELDTRYIEPDFDKWTACEAYYECTDENKANCPGFKIDRHGYKLRCWRGCPEVEVIREQQEEEAYQETYNKIYAEVKKVEGDKNTRFMRAFWLTDNKKVNWDILITHLEEKKLHRCERCNIKLDYGGEYYEGVKNYDSDGGPKHICVNCCLEKDDKEKKRRNKV